MNKTTKTLLWVGGLTAGIVAGALIAKNQDKLPRDTKKLNKWLNDLKQTLETTSKKVVDSGSKVLQNGAKVLEKN